MSKTMTYVVAGAAAILIIVLAVVFIWVLSILTGPEDGVEPTLVPTAIGLAPTTIATVPPTLEIGVVPPTFTPLPTSTATDTPVPVTPSATSTPLPTNTLPPNTPTNTPIPPTAAPTNPPPPPPPPAATDTRAAPPPPPNPGGLVATHFGLQDRSVLAVNQQIWFEFTIVNTTGGEVPYYRLGVMPKKGGADRTDWFKQSYGGPNASIKPDGLTHEDHIRLPEGGDYTLRLVICFDGWDACNSGSAGWVTMSHEIPVFIQ